MNHYSLEVIGKDHELDLIREAEQRQLANSITAGQPGAMARLLNRLGWIMVKIGENLQRQPASKTIEIHR